MSMKDDLSDEGEEENETVQQQSKGDARPRATSGGEKLNQDNIMIETQNSLDDINKLQTTYCDEVIARLIRKCWQQKPEGRP